MANPLPLQAGISKWFKSILKRQESKGKILIRIHYYKLTTSMLYTFHCQTACIKSGQSGLYNQESMFSVKNL